LFVGWKVRDGKRCVSSETIDGLGKGNDYGITTTMAAVGLQDVRRVTWFFPFSAPD
jgi:hypothetical protein